MEKGGPKNVVTCIKDPTIESAKTLMGHDKIFGFKIILVLIGLQS